MKKAILILAVVLMVGATFAEPVISKDKEKVSLSLTWTQALPTPNDLIGWNILWSDKKGGPYILWQFVEFEKEQNSYSLPLIFKEVKSTQKYFFIIQAVNADKIVSGYSTEVEASVAKDTTSPNVTPPAVPGGVQITVK